MSKLKKYIVESADRFHPKKFWKIQSKAYSANPIVAAINRLRVRRICSKFGAYIGVTEKKQNFAEPPILPHGLHGIHIAGGCTIGKGCCICQNVTIGESKHCYPIIGDNCTIGANAVILGGITIGNNVRIGGGSVVVTDIPDNATVVMNKPRVIVKDAGYFLRDGI